MATAASPAPRTRDGNAPAPATGPTPATAPAVEVTALTAHDDFLLEIGQTLGGQAAVRPVDSIEAALPHLASRRRGQLLVIDARGVSALRAAADAAHAEAPHAVVLVFSDSAQEAEVAASLKGSKVFAVLPLPVDARKTQAVFEGALADAIARRDGVRTDEVEAPPRSSAALRVSAPPAPVADDDGGGSGQRKLLVIGAALLAALAVAGAAWFFLRSPGTPAPAAASVAAPPAVGATPAAESAAELPQLAAPAADTSIVHGKVDELLEKARAAMHERRYTEPAGDNALVYYRSAAAADAASGEARDGLQRVAAVLAGRFEEALNGGRFEEAALTLANFRAATPGDARGGTFAQRLAVAQVGKAMAEGNLDRAAALVRQAQQSGAVPAEQISRWRAELARHQEDGKVQKLATLVEERIRDGHLTDGEDSARSYAQQLTATAPNNAVTVRTVHELNTAYLRKAREAALAKNGSEQERWLAEARAAGVKPAELTAYQKDLASSQRKATQAEGERVAQLFRDRLAAGSLTDPAQDNAAYYLTQLQGNSPNDPVLAAGSRDLAARLVERARGAAAAGKSPDSDLAAARHWGADPAAIAAVQQLASQPKSPAAAVNAAAFASKLKQTRFANPDYPQSALNHQISGSVVLTYTVDTGGVTRDVHVVEANPPGVFDNAAVNAVKRWRYAPMLVNGTAIEVPVKTQVVFQLPK